ncbi:hypothetical protein [Streptomyces sp. NPDC056464]|uniref:hypothetical protein n=1 Tax=Streptomyces sp. NPDC056464 TaxID=3345828 RepID=UPI0036D0AC0F
MGLLSGLPRKNCWTIAGHAGHVTPDGLQHLLARAKWDAEAVRDEYANTSMSTLATPRPFWSSTRPAI